MSNDETDKESEVRKRNRPRNERTTSPRMLSLWFPW